MKITPQTHPHHFHTVLVGEGILPEPYTYQCPRPSIGLEEAKQEKATELWRSEYKRLRSSDLDEAKQIVPEKYGVWLTTDEAKTVSQLVGMALTNMLFIPVGNTPSITDDGPWFLLTEEELESVKSFTKPNLRPNSDAPKSSVKNAG